MPVINIIPVPKPRQTRRDKWLNPPRDCVYRYREFANQIKKEIKDLPVPCKVIFYLPIPKSTSKKKAIEMEGKPHLKRPDRDNLDKALCDAIYGEDSHVWSLWSEKRWSKNPRIEILPLQNTDNF